MLKTTKIQNPKPMMPRHRLACPISILRVQRTQPQKNMCFVHFLAELATNAFSIPMFCVQRTPAQKTCFLISAQHNHKEKKETLNPKRG